MKLGRKIWGHSSEISKSAYQELKEEEYPYDCVIRVLEFLDPKLERCLFKEE
jgi:hypothetical protein